MLCGASFCVCSRRHSLLFLGVIRHCVVSMIGSNILTWIFCARPGEAKRAVCLLISMFI